MGLATLYNYAPTAPVQITRENYNAVGGGDNIVGNIRRAFKSDTDFEIWDAAVLGTQLVDGVDYELRDLDNVLTNDAGYDVYSAYKILNVAYQACNLYITYKIVMSYNDAATDNDIILSLATKIANSLLTEQGDIIYASAASTPAALHHGNSGDLLSSGGHAANPSWVLASPVPAGATIPYSGLSAPSGFLLCDGSAISRATYATLYGIITISKGNCTISQANPGVVTLNGHGLITGDCIELTTTGTLPTGLSVNTNYYVIYLNANTFNLASTLALAIAGTGLQTTSAGAGTHTLRYCPFGISTVNNFLLPNTNNVYMRGANVAARTIAAQASISYSALSVGLLKNDRLQGHWHKKINQVVTTPGGIYGFTADTGGGVDGSSTNCVQEPVTDGANGTPRTGTTSEPQSIGINYIIKY